MVNFAQGFRENNCSAYCKLVVYSIDYELGPRNGTQEKRKSVSQACSPDDWSEIIKPWRCKYYHFEFSISSSTTSTNNFVFVGRKLVL